MKDWKEGRLSPPLPDGSKNRNPSDVGFWSLVAEDLRTHDGDIFSQGFWAVFWHRFGNWRMSVKPKLLRASFSLFYKIMYKCTQIFCGIKIDYAVPIGRRVKFEHFGGVIAGARQIGDDVIIRQNTTIGIARMEDLNGKPIIENGVNIGAGAALLGDIVIGAHSVIGANAVVTEDVPPYSLVVGVPGRIVKSLKPEAGHDDQPADFPAAAPR